MAVSFIQKIRRNIVSRLSDDANGFNPTLATACTDYDISPLPAVDFSVGSSTFFQGDVDVSLLELNSAGQYPLIKLYFESAQQADSKDRSKPREFEGEVVMIIEVFIAFSFSEPPDDFESHSDAAKEALVHTFNATSVQSTYQQGACVYNGDINFQAIPMQLANKGQLWLVGTRATLSFRSLV